MENSKLSGLYVILGVHKQYVLVSNKRKHPGVGAFLGFCAGLGLSVMSMVGILLVGSSEHQSGLGRWASHISVLEQISIILGPPMTGVLVVFLSHLFFRNKRLQRERAHKKQLDSLLSQYAPVNRSAYLNLIKSVRQNKDLDENAFHDWADAEELAICETDTANVDWEFAK